MYLANAIMPPNATLQFLALLTFFTPIRCKFEFSDEEAVYDFIIDAIPICEVSCVAIMHPPDESPSEKSVINRLTYRLAKEYKFEIEDDPRVPTIMSYTTRLYEKFYMDNNRRSKDSCIFWITVVMANNSTNEQLAYLSHSGVFDYSYWVLFANRTEYSTFFRNVQVKLTTKFFVVLDQGNGLFKGISIDTTGAQRGYILWSKKDKFQPGIDIYPNLTGLTLKVGTIEFLPYLKIHRNQSGQITTVSGFYGDLWNDLQETLKFHSVFVEPEDGIFGSYNANGNWTGLYRLIARQQADVLLNEMTISSGGHKIVDYLHPIERTKYKIFYQKDAEIFDWVKVFRPLDYSIWIALIIWILTGGTAAYFVTTVEKNFQHPRRHFSFISCIYFVLRTLCNQGSEQVPKLWALRIFFLTAYLIASVILPSYSASLISVLTVKTPVEPFKELNDVLSTDFKIIMESNSTDYDFFEKTSDPIHQKIYQTSVLKDNHRKYTEAMEIACKNRRTVFFSTLNEVAATYSNEKIPCVLLPLQSEISPAYKTIAVYKQSVYSGHLKKTLLRLIEKGIVNRYKRQYLPEANGELLENDIGIGLLDVGAIFIYFGILVAFSVVILCLEIFSSRNHVKKQRAPYQIRMKQESINLYGTQPKPQLLLLEDFKSEKPEIWIDVELFVLPTK